MKKENSINKDLNVIGNNLIKKEEDLRFKLLNPFLQSLGFHTSEISLEKNFSLRLGTSEINISNQESNLKRGRLDILCHKNKKNLFVIELKNDKQSISENDRDQGISYARLLDNIAPFTIVTNGHEVHIYDTITREKLNNSTFANESDFWNNGCELSGEDLKVKYQALKHFVSYSDHNLRIFCKEQVSTRMENIIGNSKDRNAKYIQEIHSRRESLHKSFNEFISSDSSFFAIYGNSGVGKTSSICSLTQQSLDDRFVLFYNGTFQKDSPLDSICKDLNIFFSESIDKAKVLNRLSNLASSVDKQLLVFIDAIDESSYKDMNIEIGEIALELKKYDKIKFCISSKTSTWDYFLYKNGTKSYLFDEIYTEKDSCDSNNDKLPGFELFKFSDEELEKIFNSYKKFFQFEGELNSSLRASLRNGFFLRVFSEVYKDKPVPESVNKANLINEYLKSTLRRSTLSYEIAIRILSKVGKILVSSNVKDSSYYKFTGARISKILEELGLPTTETLPEALFERNILVKTSYENHTYIDFYYSTIRDYIICYHSFDIPTLENQKFEDLIHEFANSKIGYSAIYFYASNTKNSGHKFILEDYQKFKYLEFIESYNEYLNEHFYAIKSKFNPYTKGEIGILISKNKNGLVEAFSLIPLQDDAQDKLLEKNIHSLDNDRLFEYVKKLNINTISYGNKIIQTNRVIKEVENQIYSQLKKILQNRDLNETNVEILLLEKAVNLIYLNRKELNLNSDSGYLWYPRYNSIYPLKLDYILEVLNEKLILPELKYLIQILIDKGYSVLNSHYLPTPDLPYTNARKVVEEKGGKPNRIDHIISVQFSDEQMKLYLREFFMKFEKSYEKLVEYCFPTIKDEFQFYNTLPHKYVIYKNESDIARIHSFSWGCSDSDKTEISFSDQRNQIVKGNPNKLLWTHGARFSSFLRNIHNSGQKGSRENYYLNTIQYWTYRFIENDLKQYLRNININVR